MTNILKKKFFDQKPGSGRNNSISCLDDSISCFENQFWIPWNKWETFYKKKFFAQRPGKRRNNSIYCLDNSISCFENQYWIPWNMWETFCKISFLIRCLEVGDIIPFPVWIIPFSILKINFESLGTNEKHFVK